MRVISTLCLLFIASYCFAQPIDTSKVVITGNCWCIPKQTPAVVSLENGLTGKVVGVNIRPAKKDTAKRPVRIRIHCMRTIGFGDEPLFVVDGMPLETGKLSDLKPENIDSIWILKGANAMTIYGSAGINGVIIITTKNPKNKKFIIKDFFDGSRIPGATVSFIATDKKDTLMLAANDSGLVVTDKLKSSAVYEIVVSAVGYKSIHQSLKNSYGYKEHEIQLRRDVKICNNVLITSHPVRHHGCSSHCLLCRISGVTITVDSVRAEQKCSPFLRPQIYPNPVQRGGVLNLAFNNDNREIKSFRIVSMDGREMLRQTIQANEGKHIFQRSTDARWAAGIYFVQLLCKNGRMLTSDKIVIQ